MSQTQTSNQNQIPPQPFLDAGEVLEELYQERITEHIIDDIRDFIKAFPDMVVYSVVTLAKDNSEQVERLCISIESAEWAEELCREIDYNLSYFKSITPENVIYAAMTHSVHRIIEIHDRLGWYRIQIVIPLW